jgi:phytoene/squalene synthetase
VRWPAWCTRRQPCRATLLDALLEGFAWDAEGRRYETLEDLHDYAARVAGTVGAMMALVMETRTARRWPAPANWAWPCS